MKTYHFTRSKKYGPRVCVVFTELNPRLDLHNHSPDGFNWGYCGSGPAQLALALLADALRDDEQAWLCHQAFKVAVLSGEERDNWTLTDEWIRGWHRCYVRLSEELRERLRKGDSL